MSESRKNIEQLLEDDVKKVFSENPNQRSLKILTTLVQEKLGRLNELITPKQVHDRVMNELRKDENEARPIASNEVGPSQVTDPSNSSFNETRTIILSPLNHDDARESFARIPVSSLLNPPLLNAEGSFTRIPVSSLSNPPLLSVEGSFTRIPISSLLNPPLTLEPKPDPPKFKSLWW
ncbi:hypothetical protein C1645_881480 [Glomus cerebriforme]|uniref:Uncharacterized protein n=1 Tax=Glomus cerebriforme TaxID=658196 RepID=A0A397S5K7_9GLOM|nr:hypothetical protein C1645_881480 [Glomus cerebriforme]